MAMSFYFTGGGSATSVLGGLISTTAVTETEGVIFPNVALADAITGITHYACIVVKNTGAVSITNPGVYFYSDVEGSNSYIALGLTGKNSTTEQTIAGATTAPTGALVYQHPGFYYSPVALGTLDAGEFIHIWLKRIVSANATGSPKDYFLLTGVES